MGITEGETISISPEAQSLYPPPKADFFVGVFVGFGGGDIIFWHPKVGTIPIVRVSALPHIDAEIGESLIWELEMAVIHYHKTGECAHTLKFPGGIVGILPPISDPEEVQLRTARDNGEIFLRGDSSSWDW